MASTRLRGLAANISAGPDMAKDDKKAERLAAALRENLKRRKAQNREQTSREAQPNRDPSQPAKE